MASVQLDDPAGNLFDTIWFGWPYLWLAKRAMNPQRPLNVLWFQFTARAVATALTFLWAWPQPYVFLLGFLFLWFPPLVAMGIVQLIAERPLMAESGPSISPNFHDLNVRFGEKQTFKNWLEISSIHRLPNGRYALNSGHSGSIAVNGR